MFPDTEREGGSAGPEKEEEEGRLLRRRVFPESQGCARMELPSIVVVAGVLSCT